MDVNRLHLVLLSLLLVLMGFHGYATKRQDDSMRRVETSVTEMRQMLAEMRNKLPQGPPPTGMTGGGQTSQFPPGLGSQGNPGQGGGPGSEKGEKGQHKGKGNGAGKGLEPSPMVPGGPGPSPMVPGGPGPSPMVPGGPGPSPMVPGGPGPSPAGPSLPPLASPGHPDSATPSTMANLLARLIVLEYRADMALTDAQTTAIKLVLQKFKSHGVELAAVEKVISEKLTPKQQAYLKDEGGQVKTKAQELSSISGKDDYAYAELALDFLDKPIRPSGPASP